MAAAPIEAAEAAETAAESGSHKREDHHEFAPAAVHKQVGFHVLLAQLLGQLQAHRAVLVINLPLCVVAQYAVCLIHVLKLNLIYLVSDQIK